MGHDTAVGVNQSGKSGGDVTGNAGSDADAFGGGGYGSGSGRASGFGGAYAEGTGIGVGGDAGAGAMAGQAGGDVTDNTSIGDINISS
jgi:hypothetical protein